MALENAKALFASFQFTVKPTPSTPEQIAASEQQLGFTFPPSYKEFLAWMGDNRAGMLIGSDWLLDDLPDLKHKAQKMIADNHFPKTLPDDAFVFWINQLQELAFLRLSQGDGSLIYRYHTTLDQADFSVLAVTFEQWLVQTIQQHVDRMHSFGQPY